MSWLAIKHKNTGLFYNDLNWVELDKARLFKRKADLNNFLKHNCVARYINGRNPPVEGLAYFDKFDTSRKIKVTGEEEFEIVNIKLEEFKNECF